MTTARRMDTTFVAYRLMTRKHYEAIAACIKYRYQLEYPADKGGYGKGTLHALADELADYFEQDNPKFQRARFLQGCGVEPTKTCYTCNGTGMVGRTEKCLNCEGTGKLY